MTTSPTAEERLIEVQRKTVQDHIDGECESDYDKVNATFVQANRAYYQVVPGGVHYHGIEGVESFYELLDSLLPDLVWDVTHEYDVPGCSIREGTASGTHSAEFAGVPASGNFVSFEVCALYIFDEEEPDKLIAERAYWDNDSLIRQMKGETVPRLGLANSPRRRDPDPRNRQERSMSDTTSTANISTAAAHRLIEAGEAKAAEIGVPSAIAICDTAGVLKAFSRMDGTALMGVQVAQDKAFTAVGFGMSSHDWYDFIKDDPPLLAGAPSGVDRLVVFGGGFPLLVDEVVVGGIGVSGGHWSQDVEVAEAALAALGG